MQDKIICEEINSKGFGIIPKLIMQDRAIHATAKCLYAYFCSFTGAGNTCFPTRKKICFDLCISIDTFGKYLKQLIEHGYIKCEQIKENGRFSHNVYTICSTIAKSENAVTPVENTVSENIVYDRLDTNNNITNNNNIISKVSKKVRGNVENHNSTSYAKKEKNKTKEKKPSFNEIIIQYAKDDLVLIALLKSFIQMRYAIKKPLTNEGLLYLLESLDDFSHGSKQKKRQIVKNSISGSYSNFFPLRQDEIDSQYD